MACALRPSAAPPPRPHPADGAGPGLTDRYGRQIRYLRVSVTDRCNLRCHYCAPVSRGDFLPRSTLLTDDELLRLLRVMARRGLQKVRFTGGEPLVRPGFVELVRRVRTIGSIRKLCVSTNGVLLERMAHDLIAAGIDHFNISLDTLDPERFRRITRGGSLAKVLAGMQTLLALGDTTVKINAVLMRGINDDQLDAFFELTRTHRVSVRFIELMPLAHCGELHDVRYLPATRVLDALERAGADGPLGRGPLDGPARTWRLPGAAGTIGLISAVTDAHFCDECNRVRLSADGRLKLCLFGDAYVDLRPLLRERDTTDAAIEAAIDRALDLKPEKMSGHANFTMIAIGG